MNRSYCLARAEEAEALARMVSLTSAKAVFADDAKAWRARAANVDEEPLTSPLRANRAPVA